MYIIADFSKMLKIEDYHETVASKLKDLDVGVLAVNAGFAPLDLFEHQSNDTLN